MCGVEGKREEGIGENSIYPMSNEYLDLLSTCGVMNRKCNLKMKSILSMKRLQIAVLRLEHTAASSMKILSSSLGP